MANGGHKNITSLCRSAVAFATFADNLATPGSTRSKSTGRNITACVTRARIRAPQIDDQTKATPVQPDRTLKQRLRVFNRRGNGERLLALVVRVPHDLRLTDQHGGAIAY